MEINVFQRIQQSLVEKRQNLGAWLMGASADEKAIRLGPAEDRGVQTHLETIDWAIERASEHKLGICEVCHEPVDSGLLQMDYAASVCLEHLSAPERDQLEAELEFTQQVQQALLPQHIPQIPGFSLAAFSRPAQIVSGDYFDFTQFNDGAPGIAVADAMGHGVSASLITSSLQTALRTLAPECDSPAEVLERIHRYFMHNSHLTTFMTAFLGKFDRDRRVLTYCNAGHNPPALYRARRETVEWLAPTGAAIGLIEDNPLNSASTVMEAGDILLLYTDGVTEAINGVEEAFGNQRLAAALRHNAHLPCGELVQAVRQALLDYTGGAVLSDDVTLVAGKVGG